MDQPLNLEQLSRAWQQLDQRLQQTEYALQVDFSRRHNSRVRSSLRPLHWGQTLQALFGTLVVLFSASFWVSHRDDTLMLLSGVVMHAYGVALIIGAAIVLTRLQRLDYAGPVLVMQRQLAQIRLAYVRCGMLTGLPWWILWIPAMAMLFKSAFGVSFYANAPLSIVISLLFGVCGLLATFWFHRYAQSPHRPRLKRWMERALSGESLHRAQAELRSLTEFAAE